MSQMMTVLQKLGLWTEDQHDDPFDQRLERTLRREERVNAPTCPSLFRSQPSRSAA